MLQHGNQAGSLAASVRWGIRAHKSQLPISGQVYELKMADRVYIGRFVMTLQWLFVWTTLHRLGKAPGDLGEFRDLTPKQDATFRDIVALMDDSDSVDPSYEVMSRILEDLAHEEMSGRLVDTLTGRALLRTITSNSVLMHLS